MIWLNGTTLEEVEKTHKATLLLALDVANKRYAEYEAARAAHNERLLKQEEEHRRHVAEAAKKIKFD